MAVLKYSDIQVGDNLIICTHGEFESVIFETTRVGRVFPFDTYGVGLAHNGEKTFYLTQIKMNITDELRKKGTI